MFTDPPAWEIPMLDPEHVAWCRRLWTMLTDGGSWGLPNSGLIFRKDAVARELVLVNIMPHMDNMPVSSDELLARQLELYIQTQQHFKLIGVHVRRECEWPGGTNAKPSKARATIDDPTG